MRKRVSLALRRATEHPLLLFVLIGAALFALDVHLNPRAADQSRRIEVPASFGTPVADPEDLPGIPAALTGAAPAEVWIDEEVLFREAIALGLERDDLVVRRRLVQKMLEVIEASTQLAAPSPAALQAWLEQHPQRYAHPPQVAFEQRYFSRSRGERMRPDSQRALARLQAGEAADAGDALAVLTGARLWTPVEISGAFGGAFAQALQAQPVGVWTGPIESGLGLHLVQVTRREPGRAMTVDEAGTRLRSDFEDDARQKINKAAIQSLRARYRIVAAPSPP